MTAPPLQPSAPDESTTGRHIPALDGLRGLAILLVLACHLLWSNPQGSTNPAVRLMAKLLGVGWIGVDLFFVLSGFLITGILFDTLPSQHFFRNFYARRVLRIAPLYYGFLLVLVVVTLALGYRLNPQLVEVFFYVQNLHPVGVLTSVPGMNINHFWSLAIEEQFYLLWPVAVFLLKTRRRIAIAALCGVLMSVAARQVVVLTFYRSWTFSLYGFTPCNLDGLFLGALLAMMVRSRFRASALRAAPAVFLGASVVFLAVLYKVPYLEWDDHLRLAVWLPLALALGFTALVALALVPAGWTSRIFSAAWLRFFGHYSYGLYVFHYTIADLGILYVRPWIDVHTRSKLAGVLLTAAIALAASIGVAWLSFNFYERRFLLMKDRFTSRTSRPKLQAVVAKPLQ